MTRIYSLDPVFMWSEGSDHNEVKTGKKKKKKVYLKAFRDVKQQ